MKMLKTALCLSVPAFILCMGSSNAAAYDTSPDKHTLHIHTPELKSAPSYQLASITWLPDYDANEKVWGKYIIKTGGNGGGHDRGDGCDSKFNLSKCPDNGDCDDCPTNRNKIYFKGCKSGYIANGNSCICPTPVTLTGNETCSQYCDNKCIAKKCIPTPSKTDCSNGTVSCDDGCGGTRNCCNPCTHTVTNKPEHSIYTYTPCTDNSGTNNIQTGWECENGYIKSDTGDTCVRKCTLPTCSNAISSKPANSSYTTASCTDCSGTTIINTGWACDSGYTKSGDTCVEKPSTPECEICAPGKILFSDGTCGSKTQTGKTVAGIVLSTTTNLVMSTYSGSNSYTGSGQAGITWSYISGLTNHSASSALTDMNGKNNTALIKAHGTKNKYTYYPVDAALSYNSGSIGQGNWFIPSGGQAKLFGEHKDALNQGLSAAGYGIMSDSDQYWTSSGTIYTGANPNTQNYFVFKMSSNTLSSFGSGHTNSYRFVAEFTPAACEENSKGDETCPTGYSTSPCDSSSEAEINKTQNASGQWCYQCTSDCITYANHLGNVAYEDDEYHEDKLYNALVSGADEIYVKGVVWVSDVAAKACSNANRTCAQTITFKNIKDLHSICSSEEDGELDGNGQEFQVYWMDLHFEIPVYFGKIKSNNGSMMLQFGGPFGIESTIEEIYPSNNLHIVVNSGELNIDSIASGGNVYFDCSANAFINSFNATNWCCNNKDQFSCQQSCFRNGTGCF